MPRISMSNTQVFSTYLHVQSHSDSFTIQLQFIHLTMTWLSADHILHK